MARLTRKQVYRARRVVAQAALLGYTQRPKVHYSQGASRWNGIATKRDASKGQYPTYADCSAYATWALWNALYLDHHYSDVVNGLNWQYGNTDSQIRHGQRVPSVPEIRMGDLVFYANSGTRPTHVAVVVGRKPEKTGRPYVVSHGSESGPLFLPFDYRRRVQVRRYIF
jgi:cell wall-associated NlpC family hydrolase